MKEKIVALAGGVGGAKLAYGLAHCKNPENLTVIVNTADDFEHYGLYICPDLDTVCYNLAEISNLNMGWGRGEDSFVTLSECIKYGGPSWFTIGDKDLGIHLERTRRLIAGDLLSDITKTFCEKLNIRSHIIPMTNQKVTTILNTIDMGKLAFQEYFVHQECKPRIKEIWFEGIENAFPCDEIFQTIDKADLIIICPSNPWVSIDPILSLSGLRDAIINKKVIAVSPIIQNKAIKGPAAKMFSELGFLPSACSVAEHYKGLIKGFVFDSIDINEMERINRSGIISFATNTIMKSNQDKVRLAREVINFSRNF